MLVRTLGGKGYKYIINNLFPRSDLLTHVIEYYKEWTSDIAEPKSSLISAKFSHSQQNAPMDSRDRDYLAQIRK